jgi:phosphoribosylanthranilate isomerase
MVKVKVCGITNPADAGKALEFGADALGFNFYAPSPRCITQEQARAILQELPAGACNVALFVNETKERVRQIIAAGDMPGGQHYQSVQFHGEESAEYCRGWPLKVIKAFRLKEKESIAVMKDFPADFYLLDSWSRGYGGSGSSFPWEWLAGVDPKNLILSGGLSTLNVAEAIRRIRPFGVDVCTGVESCPGIKDHAKLKAFIDIAKSA